AGTWTGAIGPLTVSATATIARRDRQASHFPCFRPHSPVISSREMSHARTIDRPAPPTRNTPPDRALRPGRQRRSAAPGRPRELRGNHHRVLRLLHLRNRGGLGVPHGVLPRAGR